MGRPLKEGRARDKRVTIRLPSIDRRWLLRAARVRDASVNDVVLEAIRLLRSRKGAQWGV